MLFRSRLAAYIGFRAQCFAAAPDDGASLAQLLAMARHNAASGVGATLAQRLDPWAGELAHLDRQVRRLRTDNRLHAWEWLRTSDGRLMKTDALDHHAAHDLVGCQDITWDIAGAGIEFGLAAAEQAQLCDAIECITRTAVDRRLLAFSQPCYAAFQFGYWSLAADALAGFPAEARRTRAAADAYGRVLARLIET